MQWAPLDRLPFLVKPLRPANAHEIALLFGLDLRLTRQAPES